MKTDKTIYSWKQPVVVSFSPITTDKCYVMAIFIVDKTLLAVAKRLQTISCMLYMCILSLLRLLQKL